MSRWCSESGGASATKNPPNIVADTRDCKRVLWKHTAFQKILPDRVDQTPILRYSHRQRFSISSAQAALDTDLSTIAPGLKLASPGFWRAEGTERVSYPPDGNAQCLAVEDDSFWFRHRNAVIKDLVATFPPDGPILDVGAGNGYVARGLESAGHSCIALEPSESGAANAIGRGLRTVVCSTVESARFRSGSVSAIGLFDVLEHVQHDRAFLAHLHDIMKPGGRIYVTVPAFMGLWSTDDDYAQHQRRYSIASLRRSLSEADFPVDYMSYYFVPLTVPVFLFRTIPSRLGFRRKTTSEPGVKEHSLGGGPLRFLADRVLRIERERLKRKTVLPFGASCIAVARRA